VSLESLLADSEPGTEEGVTKLNCAHIFCRKEYAHQSVQWNVLTTP
jgi:hypothetical protein